MRRRRVAAWLLSLPLMAAGSEVAHALAYQWVYPNAHLRLQELLTSGHSYMDGPSFLPMLLGAVFAIELVGVGWALLNGVRRGRPRPIPPGAFALLPVIAFTLQELMERWLTGGSFPWWMVEQPTFRIGLAIQIPVGLLAYLFARVLLRAAHRAGRALRGAAPHPPTTELEPIVVGSVRRAPRARVPAGAHRVRGPPPRRRPSPSVIDGLRPASLAATR